MSNRGDVVDWIKTRLSENVDELREVTRISRPEEIAYTISNPPSACVIITPGDDTEEYPDATSQFIMFPVIIYYSALGFTGLEDVQGDVGAYDLYDLIYTALTKPESGTLNPPVPTGAYTPLRYRSGETESIDDGLVIESMVFDVGIILGT